MLEDPLLGHRRGSDTSLQEKSVMTTAYTNNADLAARAGGGDVAAFERLARHVRAQVTALETDRDVLSHSREALVVVVKELRDQLAAQGGPGGG